MGMRTRVVRLHDVEYVAFKGACVLADALIKNGDEDMWISKAEYEEYGSNIIYKKFFWIVGKKFLGEKKSEKSKTGYIRKKSN